MASLGQEMKNLRSELHKLRVNAVEGTTRAIDRNQNWRQNATQFRIYCHTNSMLVTWEDTRRRTETNCKRKNCQKKLPLLRTTTKNEDQTMDQNYGPEARISREESRNYNNAGLTRNSTTACQKFSLRPNFVFGNNHPYNGRSFEQRLNQSFNRSDGNRSRNETFNNQNGNRRNNGRLSGSPATQRRDFSQKN